MGRAIRRWRRRRRARIRDKVDLLLLLLLLLSTPRVLLAEYLRSAAREARASGGTIRIDGYAFVALPAAEPMVEDVEDTAEGIRELRLRVVFLEHRAFVIVACMERPKGAPREETYTRVGRLAAALVDDTTLLVYAPEVGRGNLVNEETLANAPFQVRGLRKGAMVEVEFAEVSDWMYPGESV